MFGDFPILRETHICILSPVFNGGAPTLVCREMGKQNKVAVDVLDSTVTLACLPESVGIALFTPKVRVCCW